MAADLYGFDGMPPRRNRFVRDTRPQSHEEHEHDFVRMRLARGTGRHFRAPADRRFEWFAVAILGVLLALTMAMAALGP